MTWKGGAVAQPRRVQPVGYYGFGNFGDDLFVATVTEHAETLWPNARIRTFVPTRFVRAYSSLRVLGSAVRACFGALGLLWADTFAFCGGSTLEDVGGVARARIWLSGFRRFEALGVSIGPFESPAAQLRTSKAVNRMDRVVVRDRASVDRAARLGISGVRLGGDLSALSSLVSPSSGQRANRIVICPSSAAGLPPGTIADRIREVIPALRGGVSPDVQLVLLALAGHSVSGDRQLCEEVAAILHVDGIAAEVATYAQLGLEETCRYIAESLAVFTYRLHGALVAYLSDVPFLLVGHHAKCIDFAVDIDASECIVGVHQTWSESVKSLLAGEISVPFSSVDYRSRARDAYLGFAQ